MTLATFPVCFRSVRSFSQQKSAAEGAGEGSTGVEEMSDEPTLKDAISELRKAFAENRAQCPPDPQIDIRWIGGNCPVQAEGTVGGQEFYFRARGDSWSIGIGGDVVLDPEWGYEEDWGDGPYDAGWMPQHVALQMIGKAVGLYAENPDK